MDSKKLTKETILKTRAWFADHYKQCIEDVLSGVEKVKDKDNYVRWMEALIRLVKSGEFDKSLSFWQRGHFIQT